MVGIYALLVLLVTMHLALCSLLSSPGPGCSASWPGLDQKDSALRALIVDSGGGMCKVGLLVILHLALCFFPCRQAQDARHHGRYAPEGQTSSELWTFQLCYGYSGGTQGPRMSLTWEVPGWGGGGRGWLGATEF